MFLLNMRKSHRIIFHIDMNCFYASVEMTYRPELVGKPVAIAGNPEERKGIIITSSYEARAKGVKTTMPIWEAKKLCPELIVLRPNFERYRKASKALFNICKTYSPITQPVSIDEGYLDMTKIDGHPIATAKQLQKQIFKELGLPSSIGIGPNKFLAKMASDMKKPLGITVLRIRDLPQKLWNLPVDRMYGVGIKTANKLRKINIETIGDLANKDVYQLTQLLGVNGERLKNRANGLDHSPVDPEAIHDFKSIGCSQTFPSDTTDQAEIYALLNDLASKVEARLHRRQAVGKSIQIMIRYDDHRTITRSKTLQQFINQKDDILFFAKELFNQHWNSSPIRLLGITIQHVKEKDKMAKQLDLFTYKREIEHENLQSTIHQLSKKYGKDVIQPMKDHTSSEQKLFRTSFQKDFLID